jgi:hypothetical protein
MHVSTSSKDEIVAISHEKLNQFLDGQMRA